MIYTNTLWRNVARYVNETEEVGFLQTYSARSVNASVKSCINECKGTIVGNSTIYTCYRVVIVSVIHQALRCNLQCRPY